MRLLHATARLRSRRPRFPFRKAAAALMLAAMALAQRPATSAATTYTWDITPGTVGAGDGTITGGSGTWDATTGNWTTDGGANNVAYGNQATDAAVFTGAAGGSVTLADLINASALTFNTTGYTIFAGGGSLTLTGAAPTITVGSGLAATIAAPLGGTAGLTLVGGGALTLSGASGLGGTLALARGTLVLDNNAGGSFTNATANPVTVTGPGTLNYNGSATAASAQAFGALTFSAGNALIQSTFNAGGTGNALTFGAFARTAGAAGTFVTAGGANGTTNAIVLTGQAAGFVNKGAFFGTTAGATGSDYAYYDTTTAAGFVRAPVYGTDAGFTAAAAGTSIASATHVQVNGNQTAQATGTSFTTLKITGAFTITQVAAATTTITGGILKTGGNTAVITSAATTPVSGGIISNGGNEFVVNTVAAADVLTFNSQLTGAGGLTKTGLGTLALGNTTTTGQFTGAIAIDQGTLAFSADANLGNTTSIVLNGGTLSFTATTGTVTPAATRIITVGVGGGTIALTNTGTTNGKISLAGGQLTGTGPLTKTGSSDIQLSGTNTYSGAFTISGLVEASANGALGTSTVTLTKAAELAVGNATTALPNTFTVSAAGSGSDPIISSIGGGGGVVSGPVAVVNPLTVALRAFNVTTTGNNLTLSGPLSGAGAITTQTPVANMVGADTLFLTGTNNGGYTGVISVTAGTGFALGAATSKGGASVTLNSSATGIGAFGVSYVPASQSAFPTLTTNSTTTFGGVFTANSAAFNTPVNLATLYGASTTGDGGVNVSNWFLGSAINAANYTAATLGASADGNYRLGGGGGALTFTNPVVTGANNLIVGDPRIGGGGTIVFAALANDFTGTVSILGGALSVNALPAVGTNGPLGTGTSALLIGGSTAASSLPTLQYTGATASYARDVTFGAGGGAVNATNTLTLTGIVTGPLTKTGVGTVILAPTAGAGTLTALTVAGGTQAIGPATGAGVTEAVTGATQVGNGTAAGTLTVNPGSTLNAAGNVTVGTTNAGTFTTGANSTVTIGTTTTNANLVVANSAAAGTLTTGATSAFTVNGAVTIGAVDVSGSATIGSGGSFTKTGSSAFTFGNRSTANANIINDTFNAAAAQSVSITGTTFQVGTTSNPDNTNGTFPLVTFTLPTGAASTSSIVASTSVVVGLGEVTGQPTSTTYTAVFNLGGGTNTITTPSLSLGGPKQSTLFGFPAGSAGSLTLSASGGGKAALVVGTNQAGATGTNPNSTFNLTTTGTVSANLGAITLGTSNNSGASTGGVGGTFTLAASGANSLVTADSVTLSVLTGVATSVTNFTNTFNVSAGTFRFNTGGTGFVLGGTATGAATPNRTNIINVSGTGLLDMNGLALAPISSGTGTSTLSITGGELRNAGAIGNFGTLTFTGGTLRNFTSVGRALTQNGSGTLLDVSATSGATSTISGAYALTAGAADVKAGKTLSIAGNLTLGTGAAANTTSVGVNVDGAAGTAGKYAITGTFNPDVSGDTLAITAASDVTTQQTYTIATFTGGYANTAGTNTFDSVLVNGQASQNTLPGSPNYVLVTYDPTDIQITVNNLAAVPEPASAGLLGLAAAGLLARRRRRA